MSNKTFEVGDHVLVRGHVTHERENGEYEVKAHVPHPNRAAHEHLGSEGSGTRYHESQIEHDSRHIDAHEEKPKEKSK